MKARQLNVRLTDEELRAARYWAYHLEMSVSEIARRALVEFMHRQSEAEVQANLQPALVPPE